MRRWPTALLPGLLAAGWILCLFAPVLRPGWVLANRDITGFHLPLRATFRQLASFGLPTWTPWVHGGQPILSNPNYGAFYPLSWLIFAAPSDYAITLLVVVHWAVAFAGAWFLARHLGCGRGAAGLAAVAYTGCGAYLSLLSALTLSFSLAWMPWVLAWGDAAFRRPAGESWHRPALLAGGALALQLLNGEPSTVLMSGMALAALAASAAARRPAAGLRLALPVLLALALATVQALPTRERLAGSPRRALAPEQATSWSLPAMRLAEVVFPRVYGDPVHSPDGFFFGWDFNDGQYPYVESLYPGLLLAVLGLSALLRGGIPRRASWALCCLGGMALALGRHDPAYPVLRRVVPGLAFLRYPEKFAVLGVLALTIAGVLAWQRLLDERQAGRPAAADFPLALAGIALAAASTLAVLLWQVPRLGYWWITTHGAPRMNPYAQAAALAYLRTESLFAVATAGAVVALLALCRWRRPSRRLLQMSAILLVAVDLWHYGRDLPRALPVRFVRQPPPLVASVLPARDRLYVQEPPGGIAEKLPAQGDPRTVLARVGLARMQPYTGLLWNLPYAFESDYDLMLTPWGQSAEKILAPEKRRPNRSFRLLGAWNVGTLVVKRTLPNQPPAAGDVSSQSLRKVSNPFVLPRFRFVPEVAFHPDHAAALAAARAAEWRVARREQWVRAGQPPTIVRYTRRPRFLEITDEGGRILVRYRAEEGALFVAATTYDPGWRATLDGKPLGVYPTAACQMGVALPPGEHRLLLQYHQPLLGAGAAVTLTALVGMAAAFLWRGRRMA
jgi:membrane protein YfhO